MAKTPDIQVITHDGCRANERPKAVVFKGERLDVEEVEESWIETGIDRTSDVSYGFLVRCKGGARFRLVFVDNAGWSGAIIKGPRLASNIDSV